MGQMKTPGVYIVEKSAFPNSVVEVATAVPAFIGYTEKADNKGKSLLNKPWRITSMTEFHTYYGAGPMPKFTIETASGDQSAGEADAGDSDAEAGEAPAAPAAGALPAGEEAAFSLGGKDYFLAQDKGPAGGEYFLYYSMALFFQNGGGPCYIVSVGNYQNDVETDKLMNGIGLLIKEQEPTMVVIPDVMLLDKADCITVQQAALAHCGNKMKNRVAILDVWGGYRDRQDPAGDCIEDFRSELGINFLDYASAYYPWVNTTIVQDKDLNYENVSNPQVLQTVLREELGLPASKDDNTSSKDAQQIEAINEITSTWDGVEAEEIPVRKALLHKSLVAISPLYSSILTDIKGKLNLLPPSAAMAGIYTMVDNSQGVWKAPANVSLSSVVSPAVNISHDEQEDLNVTPQGKSINAIRTFIGEGTLIWGARTLDGNSLDWRYINVRRTMIMLEESIKLASKAYVFENNVANTWVTVKSMISNFLTGIWKRGGLAGAVPGDAFSVHCGLGETMTPDDILEGIMRITVLVALIRPAEFIEITFQQQMQKS